MPSKLNIIGISCGIILLSALVVGMYFAIDSSNNTTSNHSKYMFVDDIPSSSIVLNLTDTGQKVTIQNNSFKALHWNGIDSYIQFPKYSRWSVGNNDFAIITMIRMDTITTSKQMTILSKWNINYLDDVITNQTFPIGYGLEYNTSDNTLQLVLGTGMNNTIQRYSWSINLEDNQWHLLLIQVSRQNATETCCYIDSVLQSARYNTYLGSISLDDDNTCMIIGKLTTPSSSSSINTQPWIGDMLFLSVLCKENTLNVNDMLTLKNQMTPS